jgi:ubiquinone/menaquinone biosynthesis C-methylase UbiE
LLQEFHRSRRDLLQYPAPQLTRASNMSHEQLAQTFDRWSQEGRAAGMEVEHGDVAAQVIAKMGVRAGEQILDLGCGNGWATRKLAKLAAGVQALGIDVSPAMVAEAERLHSLTIRARYAVGTFERIDAPDAKFQRVFSMEALYYAVDLSAALKEILRVLKPGGTADIVIDYFKDNAATECWSSKTGVPMHYLSSDEWARAFEQAGFASVTTQRVVDSRGAGDPSQFKPSSCYPSWETWKSVREAGSLWIRASKAK